MPENKEIKIDTLYVYVVTSDSGFAPNYGGDDKNQKICTLACCKQVIRRAIGKEWEKRKNQKEEQKKNIWIMGVAGADITNKYNCTKQYNIIYLMEVTEVLTFDEYYKKYQFKKPCDKNKIGDNRYNNEFISKIKNCKLCEKIEDYKIDKDIEKICEGIEKSEIHVDLEDIKKDISGEYVLLSTNFYHINCHVECGEEIRELVKKAPRGHRKIDRKDRKDICDYIECLIKNNVINKYHLKIDKDHNLFQQYKKVSCSKCN